MYVSQDTRTILEALIQAVQPTSSQRLMTSCGGSGRAVLPTGLLRVSAALGVNQEPDPLRYHCSRYSPASRCSAPPAPGASAPNDSAAAEALHRAPAEACSLTDLNSLARPLRRLPVASPTSGTVACPGTCAARCCRGVVP